MNNQNQQVREFCLSTNSFKNSHKLLINAVKHEKKKCCLKGKLRVGKSCWVHFESFLRYTPPFEKSKHIHTTVWITQLPSESLAPVPSYVRKAQKWQCYLTLAQ